MSTRSNIAIKVRPEDYSRVNEVTGHTMTDATPYLQIYVHFDGYPEHMFTELNKFWNSYEKALEIVLDGDTSYIQDGQREPYTARGESYKDNRPRMYDKPMWQQSFLYVFENNKWNIGNTTED